MLNDVGFEFLLASPPEYAELVAEIYYDGKFVALISEERGRGNFEIETPGIGLDENQVVRRVDLNGFMATVQKAKNRLLQR